MKFRAILLSLIIGYDFSLHLVELGGWVDKHPLYPNFPLLFGLISYDWFWVVFWGCGLLLALSLIFSGVTVKTTNITHVHIPEKQLSKEETNEKT